MNTPPPPSLQLVLNFLTWSRVAILASCASVVIVLLCTLSMVATPIWMMALFFAIAVLVAPAFYMGTGYCFKKFAPFVEQQSEGMGEFLDTLQEKHLPLAILVSAALSLYLELVVIRWQSTVFEFFAFYKNFSLLCCFAGLGLGYALALKQRIPLVCTMPLIFWQVLFMSAFRFGLGSVAIHSLLIMPFQEEQNMTFNQETLTLPNYIAIYSFLAVIFCLTALIFVPIGQLCGRLMSRIPPLKAYGFNLLGSLIGVVIISLLSFFWTTPVVWFGLACVVLTLFAAYHRSNLLVTSTCSVMTLIVLAWPVSFGFEKIYSPYQLIERGPAEGALLTIRAAGAYYQRILDLSLPIQNAIPAMKEKGKYYRFAFGTQPNLDSVLIVGAGSGNDVAAAIRANAKHITAVELDPAIMGLGAMYHPEKPYSDARVNRVVNDARSFLNDTKEKFDLIVFALLDSHVGHVTGLRVDSYVYTVESLKAARRHLKDGGVLSLAFAVISPQIEHKLYMMMTEAFDGHPPVCVFAGYESAYIFLQSKEGNLSLPAQMIENSDFRDITQEAAKPIDTAVPTDDWPFFYMLTRTYPWSYLPMMVLVIALFVALFASLHGGKPKLNGISFFFLGAGFMLIETKAITELGLHFGNTWLINAIVISALMVMAFFSNLFVQKVNIKSALIPFVFLFLSIIGSFVLAHTDALPAGAAGKYLAVFALTCPIFFSGIVFSCLLKAHEDISEVMFMNLLGAMFGGLLEYSAMYLGYSALYLLALVIYALAFFTANRIKKHG